jgi:hypothetical protein
MPVTGGGGQQGCETSRLPHHLNNRLTQTAVRLSALLTGRPLLPRKIPGTQFCQRLSQLQGHSAAGSIK